MSENTELSTDERILIADELRTLLERLGRLPDDRDEADALNDKLTAAVESILDPIAAPEPSVPAGYTRVTFETVCEAILTEEWTVHIPTDELPDEDDAEAIEEFDWISYVGGDNVLGVRDLYTSDEQDRNVEDTGTVEYVASA